jgi:hypothetical protein
MATDLRSVGVKEKYFFWTPIWHMLDTVTCLIIEVSVLHRLWTMVPFLDVCVKFLVIHIMEHFLATIEMRFQWMPHWVQYILLSLCMLIMLIVCTKWMFFKLLHNNRQRGEGAQKGARILSIWMRNDHHFNSQITYT